MRVRRGDRFGCGCAPVALIFAPPPPPAEGVRIPAGPTVGAEEPEENRAPSWGGQDAVAAVVDAALACVLALRCC